MKHIFDAVPTFKQIIILSLLWFKTSECKTKWSYNYSTSEGPQFWGNLNENWQMCTKGKLQSPINIDPKAIIFDAKLPPLKIDRGLVLADLVNTGNMPRIRVAHTSKIPSLNITGGPLGNYRYRMIRIDIHYSNSNKRGSEHTFESKQLPMELQVIAYNSEIYGNFSAALKSPHGIVGISIFVKIGKNTDKELQEISDFTRGIIFKRKSVVFQKIELWKLLPTNAGYITYEGSMTIPGCEETVTWILLNQPLHIDTDTVSCQSFY